VANLLGVSIPRVMILPDDDQAERLWVLNRLLAGDPLIVIATPYGIGRKTFSKESLVNQSLRIKVEQNVGRDELAQKLLAMGFRHTDFVESVGEIAWRGQVLDIFPAGTDYAARILFEYDRVESIRAFDVASQESLHPLQEVLAVAVLEKAETSFWDIFIKPCHIVLAKEDWLNQLDIPGAFPVTAFESTESGAVKRSAAFNPTYQGNISLFLKEAVKFAREDFEIHIVAATSGEAERFGELLRDNPDNTNLSLRQSLGRLSCGIRDRDKKIWIVTTHEIFARTGTRLVRAPVARKKLPRGGRKDYFEKALLQIKLGDIVVHETYGIARYRGIQEVIAQEGQTHGEFLCLEFAKRDKLYVSIEDFHCIHKYSALSTGASPRLSSLDKRSFELVKGRVKEEIQKFCQDLLKLYAARTARKHEVNRGGHHWEEEFAKSFPYEETPDQAQAIESALVDMASAKPMERLILGDVGFGKTEVAMRAAFRATANSRQVALLAPTTILAEQHYRAFVERFAAYPIKIGLFSRFQKPNVLKQLREDLKKGLVDIVIGTHALFSASVVFKDLGLLIVDEEHRFGVRQKEKLKFLAKHADALYLSATPIPRTLSGALSGFKDISIIESAPVGRLDIQTHIGSWDKEMVARAVRYEINRGGQVFYVLNDIKRLPAIAKELEDSVGSIRTAICHGQMRADAIESVMHKFLNKEIDVLFASSIIESGLDIPSVNTLLIEEAQNFGISQLYQLRGRIGRSRVKAYCYFFYPRGLGWNNLGAQAQERFKAIEEFSELGSATRLALKDLEIRGAGEFLGVRQHGFVSRIGLELYTKLLQEEMERIKSNATSPTQEWPKVMLSLSAYFPRDFMPSETERITYYRRLSQSINAQEIGAVFKELADRCGTLPLVVQNLNLLFTIRDLGRRLGLSQIEELKTGLVRFEFSSVSQTQDNLIAWLMKHCKDKVQFERDRLAFRMRDLISPEKIIDFLRKIAAI